MTETAKKPMTEEEARSTIQALMAKGDSATLAMFRALNQFGVLFRECRRPDAERQPTGTILDAFRELLNAHRCTIIGTTLDALFTACDAHPSLPPALLGALLLDRASKEEVEAGRRLHTIFGLFKEFEGQDPLAMFEATLKKQEEEKRQEEAKKP